MSQSNTPDFAMLRAVEILADLYTQQTKLDELPPPASDRAIVLFNETIALDVNATTRGVVERSLGIAFQYPARGWHTYCVRGSGGRREFLSLFYSDARLIAAELYVPQSDRGPKLEPVPLRFRIVPGEIELGMAYASLPEVFGRVAGLMERAGAYTDMFAARFPGGSAYAMGNSGRIERLALYVLRA